MVYGGEPKSKYLTWRYVNTSSLALRHDRRVISETARGALSSSDAPVWNKMEQGLSFVKVRIRGW
jgi:hypothetical protein